MNEEDFEYTSTRLQHVTKLQKNFTDHLIVFLKRFNGSIGGSCALAMKEYELFGNNMNWVPNDIDIYVTLKGINPSVRARTEENKYNGETLSDEVYYLFMRMFQTRRLRSTGVYDNDGVNMMIRKYQIAFGQDIQHTNYIQVICIYDIANIETYIENYYDFGMIKTFTVPQTRDIKCLHERDIFRKTLYVPDNLDKATLIGCVRTITIRFLKYTQRGYLPSTFTETHNKDSTEKSLIKKDYPLFLKMLKAYFYKKCLILENINFFDEDREIAYFNYLTEVFGKAKHECNLLIDDMNAQGKFLKNIKTTLIQKKYFKDQNISLEEIKFFANMCKDYIISIFEEIHILYDSGYTYLSSSEQVVEIENKMTTRKLLIDKMKNHIASLQTHVSSKRRREMDVASQVSRKRGIPDEVERSVRQRYLGGKKGGMDFRESNVRVEVIYDPERITFNLDANTEGKKLLNLILDQTFPTITSKYNHMKTLSYNTFLEQTNATSDFLEQTNATHVNTHIYTVSGEDDLRDVDTEEAKKVVTFLDHLFMSKFEDFIITIDEKDYSVTFGLDDDGDDICGMLYVLPKLGEEEIEMMNKTLKRKHSQSGGRKLKKAGKRRRKKTLIK